MSTFVVVGAAAATATPRGLVLARFVEGLSTHQSAGCPWRLHPDRYAWTAVEHRERAVVATLPDPFRKAQVVTQSPDFNGLAAEELDCRRNRPLMIPGPARFVGRSPPQDGVPHRSHRGYAPAPFTCPSSSSPRRRSGDGPACTAKSHLLPDDVADGHADAPGRHALGVR